MTRDLGFNGLTDHPVQSPCSVIKGSDDLFLLGLPWDYFKLILFFVPQKSKLILNSKFKKLQLHVLYQFNAIKKRYNLNLKKIKATFSPCGEEVKTERFEDLILIRFNTTCNR